MGFMGIEEIKTLVTMKQEKASFKDIAASLPARTTEDCRNKWYKYIKTHPECKGLTLGTSTPSESNVLTPIAEPQDSEDTVLEGDDDDDEDVTSSEEQTDDEKIEDDELSEDDELPVKKTIQKHDNDQPDEEIIPRHILYAEYSLREKPSRIKG